MNFLKKIAFLLISVMVSAGLMVSIPLLSILVSTDFSLKKIEQTTPVQIQRLEMRQIQNTPNRLLQQPRQSSIVRQTLQSGPRFAMSLGVQGSDGAAVAPELLRQGISTGNASEGVDSRPQLQGNLPLVIPEALRSAETDVSLRLQFCVDARGSAFDIIVFDEMPAGSGLANAATDALKKVRFIPASRAGQGVPFCGMELPVEVKFRN